MALKPRYVRTLLYDASEIVSIESSLQVRRVLFDRPKKDGRERKEKTRISMSSRDACLVLPITQAGNIRAHCSSYTAVIEMYLRIRDTRPTDATELNA